MLRSRRETRSLKRDRFRAFFCIFESFLQYIGRQSRVKGEKKKESKGLQEVRGLGSGDDALIVRDGVEDFEVLLQFGTNVEDGGDVAAAVAVVGSAPNSDEFVVELVFVALVDELMSSAD